MFLAKTLNGLSRVLALHEGQTVAKPPVPLLPLINLQNRKAWYDPAYAEEIVRNLRSREQLEALETDAELRIDVAFYNSPLFEILARAHPTASLLAVFRRCEGFVRSATIVSGEDRQPAGWPSPEKPLTKREQFIAMGRLKPQRGSEAMEVWDDWTAIQRNIWLWTTVNKHLLNIVSNYSNCHALYFEDLETAPERFWTQCLTALEIFSAQSMKHCLNCSRTKINRRPGYHIGPVETWQRSEQILYDELARPFEQDIYG